MPAPFGPAMMMQREECEFQNKLNSLNEKLAETVNQIQIVETDARIYDINEMQQEINMMLDAIEKRKQAHNNMMQ